MCYYNWPSHLLYYDLLPFLSTRKREILESVKNCGTQKVILGVLSWIGVCEGRFIFTSPKYPNAPHREACREMATYGEFFLYIYKCFIEKNTSLVPLSAVFWGGPKRPFQRSGSNRPLRGRQVPKWLHFKCQEPWNHPQF